MLREKDKSEVIKHIKETFGVFERLYYSHLIKNVPDNEKNFLRRKGYDLSQIPMPAIPTVEHFKYQNIELGILRNNSQLGIGSLSTLDGHKRDLKKMGAKHLNMNELPKTIDFNFDQFMALNDENSRRHLGLISGKNIQGFIRRQHSNCIKHRYNNMPKTSFSSHMLFTNEDILRNVFLKKKAKISHSEFLHKEGLMAFG